MENNGNHTEHNRPELKPDEDLSETATSFDNLIVDCLERIFHFLDIQSLPNVAGTCKRLQIEAISYFNRKFNGKDVTLYHNYSHSPYILVARIEQIKGLKSCLAFLRYFGANLSELTVQWHTWSAYKLINPDSIPNCKCHTLLDQYINRYCAGSLSSIRFYDKLGFSSENYVNPFVKVETVRLLHCGVGQQLPRFTDWFPNLRTLDIDRRCTYELFAKRRLHLTHLQHLIIDIVENDKHKTGVKNLLHANPHLQSLSLCSHKQLKMSKLLGMICANSMILKLSANPESYGDLNRFSAKRFAIDHPLIIELEIQGEHFTVEDVIYLIQHLHSLNTFKFGFKSHQDRMQFQAMLRNKHLPWVKRWKYHIIYASVFQLTRV